MSELPRKSRNNVPKNPLYLLIPELNKKNTFEIKFY